MQLIPTATDAIDFILLSWDSLLHFLSNNFKLLYDMRACRCRRTWKQMRRRWITWWRATSTSCWWPASRSARPSARKPSRLSRRPSTTLTCAPSACISLWDILMRDCWSSEINILYFFFTASLCTYSSSTYQLVGDLHMCDCWSEEINILYFFSTLLHSAPSSSTYIS